MDRILDASNQDLVKRNQRLERELHESREEHRTLGRFSAVTALFYVLFSVFSVGRVFFLDRTILDLRLENQRLRAEVIENEARYYECSSRLLFREFGAK